MNLPTVLARIQLEVALAPEPLLRLSCDALADNGFTVAMDLDHTRLTVDMFAQSLYASNAQERMDRVYTIISDVVAQYDQWEHFSTRLLESNLKWKLFSTGLT